MSSPKPQPKVPEKVFKVNNQPCSEAEYRRYHSEMKMLAQVEHQYGRIIASQMRPFRRY